MADASLAPSWRLDRRIAAALENAADADPFAVLGPHDTPDGRVVRAFVPGALGIEVLKRADRAPLGRLDRCGIEGLFEGLVSDAEPYLLRISRPGCVQDTEDPYAFGALLGELDLHLFNEGRHFELAGAFGAQTMAIDGVPGVRFAVWAPNARRVAVVGDFNSWDARRHPMRVRYPAGVWELFVPRIGTGVALQIRHHRPGWRARPAKGGSGCAANRGAAGNRLGRRGARSLSLARRGLDGLTRGASCSARADLDLRGPPRILDQAS